MTEDERAQLTQLQKKAGQLRQGLTEFGDLVERFIKLSGKAQTRFGYEAAGHIDFMRLLRKKRDFRTSTTLRVLSFVEGYVSGDAKSSKNLSQNSTNTA